MRFQSRCFRAHDPRWSFSPASGEGARIGGGRFNPVGTAALYLALRPETALREVSHGFQRRIDPTLLCEYDVDCEDVVDLRDSDTLAKHDIALGDLACAWELDMARGREPASWAIAKRLITEGAAGILVRSFAHGAGPDDHNLVLWHWGDALPRKVTVYDPNGRLPKDQSSWR